MIYVDVNVFVHAILDPEGKQPGKNAAVILNQIAKGELPAMTSFLTWDELLWVLKRHLGRELASAECKKFLKFPNLILAKIDEAVMNLAQGIVEMHKTNPRDSIHAATAIFSGVDTIISNDPDFDVIKALKRVPIEKFR